MTNKNMEDIVFLVLVAEWKKRDAILTDLLAAGIHLINTVYGKSTVNASYLMNTLGLVPEKDKAVIMCVTTATKGDAIFNMLTDKYKFDTPNTGIAFTVLIDSLSF